MEAFGANEFWLIATAIIFTVVGYVIGFRQSTRGAIEDTIDVLIDQGYIRSRKNPDGTVSLIKHSERWKDLRARLSKANETRFFKKHGVSSWREYDLKYDVDYNFYADNIRGMFHGYPYIAEITSAAALAKPTRSATVEDGFTYLKDWLEYKCRGKARCTMERTIVSDARSEFGIKQKNWLINSIAGRDSVFVAFQDERDYLLFLLKWETE